MMMQTNVVMIVVDQMRGDCLSHMGHPAVETPWLDHLARDGVTFTRAYSAVPSCIAARAGLLTGLSGSSRPFGLSGPGSLAI
jgi:arylsulfatase A-like enzyme